VLAINNDLRLSWEGDPSAALTLAGQCASTDFHTLSCGEGAKGPRLFDWAYLPLDAPGASRI